MNNPFPLLHHNPSIKKTFLSLFSVLFLLVVSFNLNAQTDSHNHLCDHKHSNDQLEIEKIKEAAFELLQPHIQETLSDAVRRALENPEVYSNPPATCFAPGTDPAIIELFYKKKKAIETGLGLISDDEERFTLTSRWDATATDGGGLGQGDLTTLTWSYVPDGTTIGNGGCQLPDAGTFSSDFITFFNGLFGGPTTPGDFTTAPWHAIFVDMFSSWSDATGLTFVYEPNDDGATNCLTSNPGIIGTRGDMRISGHLIDGNSGVLACNYFPLSSGDMILDTGDNFYGNNPGTGTTNVLAHEIGHGIGLRHVCPTNSTKLMEPFVNTAFTGPQEDDLLAANRHYGDSDEENNSVGGALNLGSDPLPATYTRLQRSIDDNDDNDYFSFTTSEVSVVSIEVTPTGTTYLNGTQNNDGSCSAGTNFDARRIAHLMFELIDTDGVTVLETANSAFIGNPESILFFDITPGTYTIRVLQQGTPVDNVQMYDISVEVILPCDLVVDCSNIVDQTLSCRADLPPVDFDLPIVIDSCGDVTMSALTIIPGNSACPGDTLFIPRTYFLQDQNGNMEQCEQLFTIINDTPPVMVCQDITVQIDNSGSVSITPADVDGGSTSTCGEALILSLDNDTFTCSDNGVNTVTLTGEDACGNTATCTASVTVESTLTVDCSNIVDMTLACRADLPPVDFDLPIIVDSCGDVTLSALTIIPGSSGCPGDTLFIPRTYFIQDAAGNMEQCMQTFTIISTIDPVFTSFPADTTVLCGAATDPAATGMAEGVGECDPASPQATVTFNDVTTPGACPAEMTITRTWTVTDRCGRSVDQDQVIMVVDTIAPTMICQDLTVQLDEMGIGAITPDQINNGSSDNCGGPVALSLSMMDFTCDNIGVNMIWLIGTDECG
ncbi:MAG: matrixin family metalloprotease, partial [Saprospiraceae bacterium]|nr:matrixin family metalloprotease [Saprospiraceae bacterium]